MLRVIRIRELILLCCTLFSVLSYGADSFDKQALMKRFEKMGLTVTDVVPSTEINGLLEIQTSKGLLFSSPKGDFFIAGTLYQLNDNGHYDDVIAKRLAPINAAKITNMKDQMIEFKAKNEKYAVTVFTDITCGYCVRLHSQLKDYNDLGITVRYLAFPRQGVSGPVAEQMAAIWCADDPKKALSDAKLNRTTVTANKDTKQCQKMITDQYNLGRELGVNGTPAIFLPNGEMVGGYIPAPQLLKRLESIN